MRTIKVKFWNGKKMSPVYELLDLLYEGVPNILQDVNGDLDTDPKKLAKIVTLEWTGLLDKNGKEIYEGDILLVKRNAKKWEVKWDFNEWRVINNHLPESYTLNRHKKMIKKAGGEYEIIGNIYENLLTKVE